MIKFSNVCKSFGDKVVLDNLSFQIIKNETVAIIGKSGSGKTTIARIIAGLETHDSGTIEVDGVILNFNTIKEIRKKVDFVFQNFNLFPHMTVEKNICYAPINVYKEDSKDVHHKAEKIMHQFNIYDCKYKYPHQLSGGQKQRVAISRALITNPKIIIFDEPTSSLDPELKSDVANIINNLKKDNITSVVITHDIEIIKLFADRVIDLSS